MPACTSCAFELPGGANFCLKCGAPQARVPEGDPLLGRVVGSYRVLAAIGQGAMGKIYRAEQTTLKREVCLKTILPHLARDRTAVQRFEQEARAASALRHPNIVGVLDVGRTDEGLLYLVMELVEGRSLRVLMQEEGPLAISRALSLQEQILSALEEAHGAGIVHRDLKPENVLVTRLRDGVDLAKVADFGLAKLLDSTPGLPGNLTAAGLVCGTPGYMAPEQIMGEVLDGRADVYAAGVVLYELLAGRPPFPGSTPEELFHRHLTDIAGAPSRVAALPLSPALDEISLRALEKKRERRYRSALEFKRALESMRITAGPQAGTTAACPACGHPEPAGRKFCGECGGPLGGPAAPVSAVSSGDELGSLQRVMPQRLIEHIAEMNDAFAGERRNVTVIFADISGFTAMSEKMDAEDVRSIVNRCFDGMVEAVLRYDGTVDKFIGDCVMALFGVPRAHEDDPERAVRCAMDMLSYLGEVNRTLKVPLGMRIGINTGEVVAGGLGGTRRMDYTVIGDVVNTAQRLESNARVGTILVSKAVRDLAGDAIHFRGRDPLSVKGKKEPLHVYEVAGLATGKEDVAAAEVLTGREVEVASLEGMLRAARGGTASGMLLLGEPGMGKTRLLAESERIARSTGLAVARARGGRFGNPVPLDLLRQSLFSICGGAPANPADADRRLGSLTGLGVEQGSIDRLLHMFGTGKAPAGFDREDGRLLDRAALMEAFLRAASGSGLCLLLDDLHLADGASLGVLDELLDRASALRLGVVATARPGSSDRILARLPRLELAPLSAAALLVVARSQVGGAELPPAASEAIAQRADGNPMVAREIVRSLIESGLLNLAGGTWRASPSLSSAALPERVALLVAARFDGLSPDARQLLRAGAVAGRVFSLDLAGAALERAVDLGAAIAEAGNRGFLAPAELPGTYQFTQAVAHEAVLEGLTRADLKHWHLRLAEALERGAGAGPEHPAEAMARHFLAAEHNRRGIRHLVVAADRFAERSEFEAAGSAYRNALELSRNELARSGGISTEEAAEHLFTLAAKATAALSMAAPDQAPPVLPPVLAAVPPRLALVARAEALRQRGLALLKLGSLSDAEAALVEGQSCLAGRSDPKLTAHLLAGLASVHEARGNLPEAARLLTEGFRAIAGGAQSADPSILWLYLNQLGRIHLRNRQPDRARELFQNARDHARRAGSALGESKAVANLGGCIAMQGDATAAAALFDEALGLAARAGDRVGVARIHYNAGRLLASTGKRDLAAQRLGDALRLSQELGWREGLALATQALDSLRAARK